VPNTIKNNIFAYGRLGTKQEGCDPPAAGVLQFTFTNNLIYFDMGYVQTGYAYCMGDRARKCRSTPTHVLLREGRGLCAAYQPVLHYQFGWPIAVYVLRESLGMAEWHGRGIREA